MFSGFYTISSGLLTRQRELDVIGNNLVNLQTPGYRADVLVTSAFEQQLMTRIEQDGSAVLGDGIQATAAVVDEVIPLFHSGLIDQTDRMMDIAINGSGFFNIQAETGEVYLTRSGEFDVDEEGYLTLPGFGRVLGQGGEILVENQFFTVTPEGAVINAEGDSVDTLLLTSPPDGTTLQKLENGMLQFPEGAAAVAEQGYTLVQGAIERSNVDMTQEMLRMIDAQRSFQSCSSALQIIDTMNRKTAQQMLSL